MEQMENGEGERKNPLKQFAGALGGSLSRERRNELYYGHPPKGAYPKHNDLEHIHDLRMSPQRIKQLYGVGPSEATVEIRASTDSKSGLIRELVEETSFTRREAEEFVEQWMAKNNLVEVDDPVMGKIIVPRGSR